MKNIKAKELNDNQREIFVKLFYEEVDFDDTAASCPWGCPWYFGFTVKLVGDSVGDG